MIIFIMFNINSIQKRGVFCYHFYFFFHFLCRRVYNIAVS